MNFRSREHPFMSASIQLAVLLFASALLGNLNAIVDSYLHPEIPYFDEEHLIVGGITSLMSGILFLLMMLYARYLKQALNKIKVLESFLPICSRCKKIRIENTDATKNESWQPIEFYIAERTATRFTHSICPDCIKILYPGFTGK